jgi:YVTN family beta-propeller protein
MRLRQRLAALFASAILIAACGQQGRTDTSAADRYKTREGASGANAVNVYLATGAGALSPAAAAAKPLVYVPNTLSDSVTVIDPATHTVVRTFRTGKLPQHVVPSYDMHRLWVTNDMDDSLTAVDPTTGADGQRVYVSDPYNLYFTPDGTLAMVIAEAQHWFDLRDPVTMKLVQSVHVDCAGLDHVDFTADDRYAIATCEFSGELVKFDLAARKPVGYLRLQRGSMPQDIRVSPDGRVMYVADMMADGAHVIDPVAFKEINTADGSLIARIAVGVEPHGLCVWPQPGRFSLGHTGNMR